MRLAAAYPTGFDALSWTVFTRGSIGRHPGGFAPLGSVRDGVTLAVRTGPFSFRVPDDVPSVFADAAGAEGVRRHDDIHRTECSAPTTTRCDLSSCTQFLYLFPHSDETGHSADLPQFRQVARGFANQVAFFRGYPD